MADPTATHGYPKDHTYEQRKAAVTADAEAEEKDEALLAEWTDAVTTLRRKAGNFAGKTGGLPRSARDPLEDTDPRAKPVGKDSFIPGPDEYDTRNGLSRVKTLEHVPKGSRVDTHAVVGVGQDDADGLALLHGAFSAFAEDLHDVKKDSPEYKRVEKLYGPARIAYFKKNNISQSGGQQP